MIKKIALVFLLIPIVNSSFAGELVGKQAAAKIAGAKKVIINDVSNVPSFIIFNDHVMISEEKAMSVLQYGLEMNSEDSWSFYKEQKDNLGFTHKRYYQYYKNIKVETGEYILHFKDGFVKHMNGVFYDKLQINTSPAINEKIALQNALNHTGANIYMWQLQSEEQNIKWLKNDVNATYFPTGELIIMARDANFNPEERDFRLCYRFDVYAHEPLSREYVYVDAHNGEIVYTLSRICNGNAVGSANTRYSGTQTINTDSVNATTYRLRDYTLGNGILTWDMNNGTNYGAAVDFTDDDGTPDNNWTQTAFMDDAAYDAHWGAENTYLYFQNVHGRASFDDLGTAINSYVHRGVNYVNAFWDGIRMTYGDGNGTTSDPLTTLDIVGHEIGHGVTEFSSNLIYSGESGGLNESFSDIFGAAIEFFADSANGDWKMGEDCWTPATAGDALRYMNNPTQDGNSIDSYLNYFAGLDVHYSSGLQNLWFVLLSDGGSGTNGAGNPYNVAGMGILKAEQIAYRNNNFYLTPSSTFADARTYSIQSAVDIYGGCTPEVESTTNAWYAVDVGVLYSPTVDASYSSPDSSCSAPFTVTFNNTSYNASTYVWDFGDGTTSNVASPTHVYNNYGTYTVSLIADGGACGVDTVIVVDQIVIDSTIACIALTGDGIQTSCNGVLYDSGGPNNDYPDNQDFVTTISPVNAANVTLTFTLFDVEPASGCIYDYIEIFDGPNTASPSMGQYCNTTGSPGIITSTGPSITVLQHSDQSVTGEGFVANWECYKVNQPPTVDFTSDVTLTCTGDVQFTDLTIGNPISWDWDFGDGNNSTLKDPFHSYSQAGIYTVSLVAVNGFGADTVVKSAFVNVTKPSAPTTTGDDNCGPASLTLTAIPSSPGNPINWFDQSSGGTSLYSGETFVTPLLNVTTTYFAQESVAAPIQKVGALNNLIGAGGNFTGSQYLVFDALSPFKLVSVFVYASGAGNRTIQLRNSGGTVLKDTVVALLDGAQRVTLNFDVAAGTDLQLGTISGTPPNLYRNSAGAAYPYVISNVVSIKTSSFSSAYYYFYYDWEVRETDCVSDRSPADAVIFPEPLGSTVITTEGCVGSSNGAIDLTVTGGTAPYNYLWSTGSTIQDLTGIVAGTYSVSISDLNDCNASVVAVVNSEPPIAITTGKSNVSCNGADNGTARAVVSGGSPTYSYLWDTSPVKTTDQVNNLAGGFYTVIVTDNRGCTKSSVISIFDPSAIGAFSIPNNPSNGDINLLVTGGIAPYTYNWSTGSTNEDLTGAATGQFYFCQISDRNSCARIHALIMPGPNASPSTINSGDILRNSLNGNIDVFPNPASESVAIVFAVERGGKYEIFLRDARGKRIMHEHGQSEFGDVRRLLDVASVSHGVYFIEIIRESGKFVEKLIIR